MSQCFIVSTQKWGNVSTLAAIRKILLGHGDTLNRLLLQIEGNKPIIAGAKNVEEENVS